MTNVPLVEGECAPLCPFFRGSRSTACMSGRRVTWRACPSRRWSPCGKCVRGGILVRAVEFIQQGECDLWLIWHPYSRDMDWLPLERPAARPKGPASQFSVETRAPPIVCGTTEFIEHHFGNGSDHCPRLRRCEPLLTLLVHATTRINNVRPTHVGGRCLTFEYRKILVGTVLS